MRPGLLEAGRRVDKGGRLSGPDGGIMVAGIGFDSPGLYPWL